MSACVPVRPSARSPLSFPQSGACTRRHGSGFNDATSAVDATISDTESNVRRSTNEGRKEGRKDGAGHIDTLVGAAATADATCDLVSGRVRKERLNETRRAHPSRRSKVSRKKPIFVIIFGVDEEKTENRKETKREPYPPPSSSSSSLSSPSESHDGNGETG